MPVFRAHDSGIVWIVRSSFAGEGTSAASLGNGDADGDAVGLGLGSGGWLNAVVGAGSLVWDDVGAGAQPAAHARIASRSSTQLACRGDGMPITRW
jgi:hypothetical protein